MSKEELRTHYAQKKARAGASAMARQTRSNEFRNPKAYTRKPKHRNQEELCLR